MSTTNAKVAIELYVDDKGTLRVREFSADSQKAFKESEESGVKAAGRIEAAWKRLQAAWVSVLAAIAAVAGAWNLANTAAKADQERRSFASLAASYGTSADKIIASLNRVSKGTIDTMTLVRNAGTAMMMGINPDDVTGLMEIARATAKMTGQTTVKAFEDITLAVGRQSKMILDNLGIILDVEKANKEYAESLGTTSAALTDTERKQAFMNATMKAGRDLMQMLGDQTESTADKFERWKARWANIGEVSGRVLLSLGMIIDTVFTGATVSINRGISLLTKYPEKLTAIAARLPVIGGLFKSISRKIRSIGDASEGASQIGMKHLNETWDTMISLWKEGDVVGGKVLAKIRGQREEMAKIAAERKKITEDLKKHQKATQNQADAEKEMYEEAGFGAEKYFDRQATELVKKAARWRKAGAEQLEVEGWLYEQLGKLSAQAYAKEEFAAGQAMDSMQAMSRTLIEQYEETNKLITEQLDAVNLKIGEIDGREIGLTASFNGGAVVAGIDELISKLRQLQTVSAGSGSSPAGGSSNTGNTTIDESTTSTVNNSAVTINVNEPTSRSSVLNIAKEMERREVRG